MTNGISNACTLVLALAFPVAALADASGSLTIAPNTNFSFDNGTSGSSGGDIRWTGPEITFVGNAAGVNFGQQGAAGYNNLTQYSLTSAYSEGAYNTTPIISLATGEVFAVFTNGGNYAKVLIISVSATALQFQYVTYGRRLPAGRPCLRSRRF